MPSRRPAPTSARLVVTGLIFFSVAVELVLTGADLGLWGSPSWRAQAYALGAFQPRLIRGAPAAFPGQILFMFLSYGFLHAGLLHLTSNMVALASLGRLVGQRFGAVGLLGIYLASQAAGALAFALLGGYSGPMVGASGALFGLVGTFAPRRAGAFWRWVAGLAVLNLALWFATSGLLAWQAHLGGFLAGLVMGGKTKFRAR